MTKPSIFMELAAYSSTALGDQKDLQNLDLKIIVEIEDIQGITEPIF